MKPDWSGQTVACIASGPSLTAEDCERIRAAGLRAVVTNTTFRLCPWADILFGFDTRWWRVYGAEVAASFGGRKIAALPTALRYGAESPTWFSVYRNSGASAVSIALAAGAARVVMLGYDASNDPDTGKRHHHEDHPAGLANADSIPMWGYQFDRLAKHAQRLGASVLNASRRTSLQCFPRVDLETVL